MKMFFAFLMGLVGGQRAVTPLAAVAVAAAAGKLPADNGTPAILAHRWVAAGASILAVSEMVGDKLKTAPDRIVPVGLTARFITSAFAGSALAPRDRRLLGAAIGGSTAVLASYPGWRVRVATISRYGQTPTGLVEDTLVVLAAAAILWAAA